MRSYLHSAICRTLDGILSAYRRPRLAIIFRTVMNYEIGYLDGMRSAIIIIIHERNPNHLIRLRLMDFMHAFGCFHRMCASHKFMVWGIQFIRLFVRKFTVVGRKHLCPSINKLRSRASSQCAIRTTRNSTRSQSFFNQPGSHLRNKITNHLFSNEQMANEL